MKNDGKMDIVLRLLTAILLTIAVFCLYFIGKQLWEYHEGSTLYDELADDFVLQDPEDGQDHTGEEEPEEEPEQTEGEQIVPPAADYDGLYAVNGDFVGWLKLDACGIDLPIVRGEDNAEYLHKGFSGGYIYQGTLFMDFRNSTDFSDSNTVIYGHNMNNGSMFGNLKKYLDKDFALEYPSFWICVEDYSYVYRIYSIAIVREDGDAYTLFSDYGEDYENYLQERQEASYIDMGEIPDPEARTITLSTCYGKGEEGNRLVVQAFREGLYPSEGCTREEAETLEKIHRESESRENR